MVVVVVVVVVWWDILKRKAEELLIFEESSFLWLMDGRRGQKLGLFSLPVCHRGKTSGSIIRKTDIRNSHHLHHPIPS